MPNMGYRFLAIWWMLTISGVVWLNIVDRVYFRFPVWEGRPDGGTPWRKDFSEKAYENHEMWFGVAKVHIPRRWDIHFEFTGTQWFWCSHLILLSPSSHRFVFNFVSKFKI